MKRAILVVALAACTATRSARTLPVGKTEVSVGVGHATLLGEDELAFDVGDWTGHAAVRHGFNDHFELGAHFVHTPGTRGLGAIGIDSMFQLVRDDRMALAFGAPVSLAFVEADETHFESAILIPSLYFSVDLSPCVELVVNARYAVATDYDRGFGASLGARFTDGDSWVAQPEAGVLRLDDRTYITLGMTIAVGH